MHSVTDSGLLNNKLYPLPPITNTLLLTHKQHLALDSKIILAGQIQHIRPEAKMEAIYVSSSIGQYGYAHIGNIPNLELPQVDIRAIDSILNCAHQAQQLAIIDAIWQTQTNCKYRISLNQATIAQRDSKRSLLIAQSIKEKINKFDLHPTVIMIGFFQKLYEFLTKMGIHVWCCDAGRNMEFPTSFSLQEAITSAILVASASYLCRDDFRDIQTLTSKTPYSVLLAQSCHNMIEYHFHSGFSLIFAETFPPFSFGISSLKVFEK